MRVALPGLGNNWMVLLKETSLVSVITLQDTMFIGDARECRHQGAVPVLPVSQP